VKHFRATIAAVSFGLLSACGAPPIHWEDAVPLPGEIGTGDQIAIGPDGALAVVTDSAVAPPVVENQCRASVRVARDTTGEWYAVWWSVRPDSTARVVVARSPDGRA
jgi:hypothetical protein